MAVLSYYYYCYYYYRYTIPIERMVCTLQTLKINTHIILVIMMAIVLGDTRPRNFNFYELKSFPERRAVVW